MPGTAAGMPRFRTLCLFVLCAPGVAQTAAPSISSGGAVNAASYSATVAPGSVISVFGNFPAGASGPPAFAMQFDGALTGPVLFSSTSQANIEVPWELSGHTEARLTATVTGQTSAPESVHLAPFAPGIFSVNMQGSGQGVVIDSSNQVVDASNPAVAGRTAITIYCTGLGAVSYQPATGAPALAKPADASKPLSLTTTLPSVVIGGVSAQTLTAGLTPGLVGVYQVTAIVPSGSPVGNQIPLSVSIGGAASNSVTIAVQPGSDKRADALVSQMTLSEKIQLVHGVSGAHRGAAGYVPGIQRLGIPDLYLVDGSVGVGNSVGPATALPSSIASAASWDLDEAYKYGKVIGAEMRAFGVNVNLGGNVNLTGREPRDGRTFETKGEDPILAGKITAAHIRGVQDQHVMGGIKHFAFNDQETDRTWLDVDIEERGGRESDLLAFEIGVKDSNAQSVMCAYNLVNEIYSCENPDLLNGALKRDWGFKGFVMSDWGATHSTAAAANAGLDMEMPTGSFFPSLGSAVQSGAVAQPRLDDMVHRILRAMFEVGIFDYPATITPVDTVADQAIAQEAEQQGAVLLKNAGGQLPLNASAVKSIAVIGSHADIGVLSGGGSAQVYPTGGPALVEGRYGAIWDPSSPLNAIRSKAPGARAQYDSGADSNAAASLAAASDVAVGFVSQFEKEGIDVPSLNFTDLSSVTPIDQDALVAAVAAANPHTIVVLENGGAQAMPWLDSVSAVLEAWYPGQRGGEAIANLLFGDVDPSGKLPITFPARVTDLPRPVIPSTFVWGEVPATTGWYGGVVPVTYAEGYLVGYKWFYATGRNPLFPFGFGLSYTTFSLSNAALASDLSSINPNPQVSFDLTNTGAVSGAEVAQVYLALPESTTEQALRLVGWKKVFLKPGGKERVTVEVDENDSSNPMSYWDPVGHLWRTASGDYQVYLGNSSDKASLMLVGTLHVN